MLPSFCNSLFRAIRRIPTSFLPSSSSAIMSSPQPVQPRNDETADQSPIQRIPSPTNSLPMQPIPSPPAAPVAATNSLPTEDLFVIDTEPSPTPFKCAIRVNVASFFSEGNLEVLLKKDLGIERFEAVFKKMNNERGVITFSNAADKAFAVSILSSATRQDGKSYKVQDIEYIEESRSHKRQRESAVELVMRKRARANGEEVSETFFRPVSEVVTPWVDVPYYEQLDRKVTIVCDALTRTIGSLRKDYKKEASRYPDLDLRGVNRGSSFKVLQFSPKTLKIEREMTPAEMRLGLKLQKEKKEMKEKESPVKSEASEESEKEDNSENSVEVKQQQATTAKSPVESAKEKVETTPEVIEKKKPNPQNPARVLCRLEVIAGWTPGGLYGYRNKLDFTIGWNENREITVGYMCGRHKEGWPIIGSPEGARNTPKIASKLAILTQDIVKVSASDKPSGLWRRVLVRISHAEKEAMVVLTVDGSALSEEKKLALQKNVLKELPPQYVGFTLTNVIWQSYGGYSNAVPDDAPYEVLRGPGSITERLGRFAFRIQPASFFQVNTSGGAVLYDMVRQFISKQAAKNSVLIDVCCGTGTIGISISKRFKRVVGFELVASAVADAEENSKLNQLQQKCKFICGKAEETLPEFVKTLDADERMVAVVDPPRAGLHKHVIRALRACPNLNTLVYVSCNPSSMSTDVAAFLRPESKKRLGKPFKAIRCGVVDMFPDTKHCECVLLLERECGAPAPPSPSTLSTEP